MIWTTTPSPPHSCWPTWRTYILSVDAANRTGRLASQLQQALDSRVVIEQAKGKLSAAWDVDVSTAFECMRRHARSNHRRLQDVAADVVDGRLQADRIGASVTMCMSIVRRGIDRGDGRASNGRDGEAGRSRRSRTPAVHGPSP